MVASWHTGRKFVGTKSGSNLRRGCLIRTILNMGKCTQLSKFSPCAKYHNRNVRDRCCSFPKKERLQTPLLIVVCCRHNKKEFNLKVITISRQQQCLYPWELKSLFHMQLQPTPPQLDLKV